MLLRGTRSLLVLLTLASYLLPFGALPNGSILCYGADGHVELESARQSCPPPTISTPDTSLSWRAATNVDAAACIDVVASTTVAPTSLSRATDLQMTSACAIVLTSIFAPADVFDLVAWSSSTTPPPLCSGDSRTALRDIKLRV